MLSFLRKWLFPSAMEDMLVTDMKRDRCRRALARFKIMTYDQWCEHHDIMGTEKMHMACHARYAEYCVRKDTERASLERSVSNGKHK